MENKSSTKLDQIYSTLKRRFSVLMLKKEEDDDENCNPPAKEVSDPNACNSSTHDRIEATCSNGSKADLLSATEFFKSFSMEPESVTDDNGAAKTAYSRTKST